MAIFRRGPPPPQWGSRMQGGMKNHDFREVSRFSSEMMQDIHSYYKRRIGNRTQAFEWYQF